MCSIQVTIVIFSYSRHPQTRCCSRALFFGSEWNDSIAALPGSESTHPIDPQVRSLTAGAGRTSSERVLQVEVNYDRALQVALP